MYKNGGLHILETFGYELTSLKFTGHKRKKRKGTPQPLPKPADFVRENPRH